VWRANHNRRSSILAARKHEPDKGGFGNRDCSMICWGKIKKNSRMSIQQNGHKKSHGSWSKNHQPNGQEIPRGKRLDPRVDWDR